MCMNTQRSCRCGRNSAHMVYRDNLLSPSILVNLYCPECRARAVWDGRTMVEDCGWVLEYDLDAAQALMDQRNLGQKATPEFILDEGYLSWQGLSPHDREMNHKLHRELEPLINQDLNLYLKSLKSRWLEHVASLKAAGWRKAQRA